METNEYARLCSEHEEAVRLFELAEKAWYYEVWSIARQRGRIHHGERFIETELGRRQLRVLGEDYVSLGIMNTTRRDALSRAQTAVYDAQLALERYEADSFGGSLGDIIDLDAIDWKEVALTVERIVELLSETEQSLAKRKEMGVPDDAAESLDNARKNVLEMLQAERRTIRLFCTTELSDLTALEFYQNAAVTEWQDRLTAACDCLNLAREMQYSPVSEVAERCGKIQAKLDTIQAI